MLGNFIESNHHFLEMLTVEAYNRRVILKYLSRLQVTDASNIKLRIGQLKDNLQELKLFNNETVNVRTSITEPVIRDITNYLIQIFINPITIY